MRLVTAFVAAAMEEQRVEAQAEQLLRWLEQAQASRNRIAKDIGQAKAKGHDVAPLLEQGEKLKALNITTVELGTGNYPGDPHCKLSMLENGKQLTEFKKRLDDQGVSISALSCHGNSLHPDSAVAKGFADTSKRTVELAAKSPEFLAQIITRFDGQKLTRLEMVQFIKEHELTHRSQMFMYLRLKGIVPATTRRRMAKQAGKCLPFNILHGDKRQAIGRAAVSRAAAGVAAVGGELGGDVDELDGARFGGDDFLDAGDGDL